MLHRKRAGNGGTSPCSGIDRYCATMQFYEGTHKGKPETGTTVLGAHRIRLEPVEHLVHCLGRDARPMIGHAEKYRARTPFGQKSNSLTSRGKANGVGQQVEQDLAQAPLVGGETTNIGRNPNV